MQATASLQKAPAELSEAELKQFDEQGYLVYRDFLTAEEVQEIKDAMQALCVTAVKGISDGSYKARRNGKPGHNMSGWWVGSTENNFGVQFERAVDNLEDLTPEELGTSYRKLANYLDKHPVFEKLAANPVMNRYLEQLLGPDFVHFQNMALSKPAKFGSEKPWHQDNAYFNVTPLDAIVGVWIAIDDATIENGCMHVLPTARKDLVGLKHIHDRDCEIELKDIDQSKVVPVEVPAGGALFFLGMLPHQTPPNRSDKGRRALQLHYHGAECERLEKDDYDKVFKTIDGRPASCAAAGD